MSVKSKIKKLVGSQNVARIKKAKSYIKYVKTSMPNHQERFVMRTDTWSEPTVITKSNHHVSFGYYDIQQIDKAQEKMLVTVVRKSADTRKDKAQLEWVDLNGNEFHHIADTSAWCWQQGARLRWHPVKENTVLYNDVENGQYVMKAVDLFDNRCIDVFPRAMYDIAPDFRYGLSLNYSRLQRLRPGYGYNVLPDDTEKEKVPVDDGIFHVDLTTKDVKLIISYEQLVALTPEAKSEWNYINHISISPKGDRFLFFHLWTPAFGARWKAKLYTARLDGSELTCLEKEYITSHYTWRDNDTLLTTSVGFGGARSYYFLYHVGEKRREIVECQELTHDGHPSFFADGNRFVTDTYPLEGCMQHVFESCVEKGDYKPVCDIYSDPRLYDEKRCDLHPRITPDNNYLTIDSTFRNGVRSVLLFRKCEE